MDVRANEVQQQLVSIEVQSAFELTKAKDHAVKETQQQSEALGQEVDKLDRQLRDRWDHEPPAAKSECNANLARRIDVLESQPGARTKKQQAHYHVMRRTRHQGGEVTDGPLEGAV